MKLNGCDRRGGAQSLLRNGRLLQYSLMHLITKALLLILHPPPGIVGTISTLLLALWALSSPHRNYLTIWMGSRIRVYSVFLLPCPGFPCTKLSLQQYIPRETLLIHFPFVTICIMR